MTRSQNAKLQEDRPILHWWLTGFPSPWRYARRRLCRKDFTNLPDFTQRAIRAWGDDPESLIRRGLI